MTPCSLSVSVLTYQSNLLMEAANSSETSGRFYQITKTDMLENCTHHNHRCESLKISQWSPCSSCYVHYGEKQRQSVHLHNSTHNCAYTLLVTSLNTVNTRLCLKVLAKACLLIYSVINCGRPLGQNNFSTERKDRNLLFVIRRKLLSQHGFETIRHWVFKN
jgi:hypothetical protein